MAVPGSAVGCCCALDSAGKQAAVDGDNSAGNRCDCCILDAGCNNRGDDNCFAASKFESFASNCKSHPAASTPMPTVIPLTQSCRLKNHKKFYKISAGGKSRKLACGTKPFELLRKRCLG